MLVSTLAIEHTLRMFADENGQLAAGADVTLTDVTGKYDTSKIMQENFNSNVLENIQPTYETRTVMVQLEGDTVIDRADGEAVTQYLNSWAGDRAVADIGAEQTSFLKALSKTGIPYSVERAYNTVFNGLAIEVNTKYVSTIKKMDGVDGVFIANTYSEPQTVEYDISDAITNKTDVYETGIYDSSEFVSGYGQGMVVAVLDTGLDYTHEAFQGFQSETVDVAWEKSDVADKLTTSDLASERRSGTLTVNDVYVSEKVPFAYDYADDDADVYPSYSNHGTHVAGIIGGYNEGGYTDKDGNAVTDKSFIGVVPDAQLVICKVFTDDLDDPDLGGAVSEDIVAALEDCVKLGVDVINMSLGTSCGFTTTDDGDEEGKMLNDVYESIKAAGISLICAASNDYSSGYGGVYGTNLASNPDSGTIGSPSTYAGALSVASINGQKAKFMLANPAEGTDNTYVYFEESRDIDGNPFDFVKGMQETYGKKEFEYVVVSGVGLAADYTRVRNLFRDKENNPRIALISRGSNTFQEKVEIAMKMGAAGVIVYNNVSGIIRMNLGEIENPVPAVSINMNAGLKLVEQAGSDYVGKIVIDDTFAAGPFMSEFSSWGPTHDLKLKPEITAHGGEITSAVPGGYDQQSGTSMATPNMAGFMALVRSYIEKDLADLVKDEKGNIDPVKVNRLAMQLTMSTAGMVYDQDGLLYSPRKQGAGVAKLENVIQGTQAYLSKDDASIDYRPKLDVGDDKDKSGQYVMEFDVTNFGSNSLSFKAGHQAMTESLSKDKRTVAEQAYMLNKSVSDWSIVDGNATYSDGVITVEAGETATIKVVLTIDKSERDYIDASFENGMYVEGFLQLDSMSENQCDLSIPFLAFYGDWEASPMLDYSAFEVAAEAQDASILEEDKIKASVWETLPYSSYYNEKYILPMGGYVYLLPDDADPMYVDEEHCSVSRYNEYYGEGETNNYLTSTSIKAVYAGLLKNARVVRYKLYNVDTGELVLEDELYRIGKAYSGGGSAVPANVELELSPELEGLVANGKYRMDFEFFQNSVEADAVAPEENTYSFSFTVDYEAPVLEDARIRYYNYKEDNKDKQRIYLDVDVYDNHYPQALLLCYPTVDATGTTVLQLATDYPTPIRNANKNGTTTVSVEITDIYKEYGSQLYIQIDDYAINSCLYQLDINAANAGILPEGDQFSLAEGEDNITLDIYETHKTALKFSSSYTGSADLSNFTWTSANPTVAAVRNGEIVGLKEGKTRIIVSNGKGASQSINVTVTGTKSTSLPKEPSISFGVISTNLKSLKKAQGSVEVNAGETFPLTIETSPWYHPMTDLRVVWSSSNESVATVDQNGNVTTLKKGSSIITANIERKKGDGWSATLYAATVSLRVQEEFTVSNYMLTDYNGVGYNQEYDVDGDGDTEKVLVFPTDMNIWYIGEEAFKDNTNAEIIVIPSSVIEIRARAFENCTALKEVYFVSTDHRVDADGNVVNEDINWAKLSLIYENAFYGCKNLKKLDLSNVKTITLAADCFADCTSLEEIVDMASIGTMHHRAFKNTALKTVDLSGLHMSGSNVFENCEQLTSVTTGKFTAIGQEMFKGCTSLKEITISTAKISAGAFRNCTSLEKVTLDSKGENLEYEIGDGAFENCATADGAKALEIVFGTEKIRSIGNRAFAGANISVLDFSAITGLEALGANIFANTQIKEVVIGDGIDLENMQFNGAPFTGVTVNVANSTNYVKEDGVIYNAAKTKIYLVDSAKTGTYNVPATVTEIAPYAFANSSLTKVVLGNAVAEIGKYAFYNSAITEVDFGNAVVTEIAEGTFYGSKLTNVTLPVDVTKIGNSAFAKTTLQSFAADGLTELGNRVFEDCTLLETVSLADSIVKMGDRVFVGCTKLVKVALPSLRELGSFTFLGAESLKEVSFGENATTTGAYTFSSLVDYTWNEDGTLGYDFIDAPPVEKVVFLGNNIQTIEEGLFYGATALTNVQAYRNGVLTDNVLPEGVTKIAGYAFAECANLTALDLTKVTEIGDYAFYNAGLTNLDLASAKKIGIIAFGAEGRNGEDVAGACVSLNMPVVEEIGHYAFYNNSLTTLNLPASLRKIGYGAFASAANLTTVVVDEQNANYFVEDNVLYRNLVSEEGGYELVLYPAAREAEGGKGEKSYVIKEGTLSVLAYAFYGLNKNALNKVTLPYSVNTIGDSAFFGSGISEYTFESIQAPVLETAYRAEIANEINTIAQSSPTFSNYRGYFYTNFETYLYNYTDYVKEVSTLKMNYPTNGKGYDMHVYKLYFGTRTAAGVYMEDNTRECVSLIEGMPTAAEVLAWKSLDKTEENKQMIREFSETVKTARLYYNNASESSTQASYMTAELTEKLEGVEGALREVKPAFNIPIVATSLRIDPDCTYKSEYNEGETFDITGLKAIVIYDDYSTEKVDTAKLTLTSSSQLPLTEYDRSICVEYNGLKLYVDIRVNAEEEETEEPTDEPTEEDPSDSSDSVAPEDGGCGGCGSVIGGGIALATVVAAAAVLVLKKKED